MTVLCREQGWPPTLGDPLLDGISANSNFFLCASVQTLKSHTHSRITNTVMGRRDLKLSGKGRVFFPVAPGFFSGPS